MATLTTRNTRQVLQFTEHGKRRTVTLGTISRTEAEQVRLNLSRIEACHAAGIQPDPALTQWTATTTGRLRDALVAAGFAAQTLTIREYLARSRSTGNKLRRRLAQLLERRLGQVPLQQLTLEHATTIAAELTGNGNTLSGKITTLRAIFRPAAEQGLIQSNPFAQIPTPKADNTQRKRFVTREEVQRIIDSTADPELRLMIALGRYAGIRIPSELLAMKWSDINWQDRRFTVTDVKRRTLRVVPIFPELATYFSEAHTAAPEGVDEIWTRHRGKSPARILGRLARRAGVSMWSKPFVAMRASRETELIEQFPIFVAAAFIGNSPATALRHYAIVRPEHYDAAARGDSSLPLATRASDAAQPSSAR